MGFWAIISNSIALWSDHMHGIILIPLHLLKHVLWTRIWSVLEMDPCAAEKNMYSEVVGLNTQYTSTRSICSQV